MADWDGGMSASCKPRVQLFADAGNGWPHSALRYIISSCQSAATSEIVKRFWSHIDVRRAITSIATFTFIFYILARITIVVCFAISRSGAFRKSSWGKGD